MKVDCLQFAKAENRWPKANINMLYDDKIEDIKYASKVQEEKLKFTGFIMITSICDKKISTPTIVN